MAEVKAAAKPNKPRKPAGPKKMYMVYKGQLDECSFTRRSDELVAKILADRDLKVTEVTIPAGR